MDQKKCRPTMGGGVPQSALLKKQIVSRTRPKCAQLLFSVCALLLAHGGARGVSASVGVVRADRACAAAAAGAGRHAAVSSAVSLSAGIARYGELRGAGGRGAAGAEHPPAGGVDDEGLGGLGAGIDAEDKSSHGTARGGVFSHGAREASVSWGDGDALGVEGSPGNPS